MQENNISLLLDKCRKNDREAQNKLYDLYFNAMFNTAYRILQNKYTLQIKKYIEIDAKKVFRNEHLQRKLSGAQDQIHDWLQERK